MNINSLPIELLEEVFKYLSDQENIIASMVCQKWHEAALRNVTRLFCHDFCEIGCERNVCYDGRGESDLDDLSKFYEDILKKGVNWWDLIVLFPKVKYLEVETFQLKEGILDAISSYLTQLDHLCLSPEYWADSYNWKNFGSKMTKLTSLKFEFHSEEQAADDFAQMIHFCQNLRKIDISFVGISNTWKGVIPKQVTEARFFRCSDDRTEREASLFAFIFEDLTTIRCFFWENRYKNLRDVDIVPLTGVIDMTLSRNSSVVCAVFEHCKSLEKLSVTNCDIRKLSRVKHVLPRVKQFRCSGRRGIAEDLKYFCPNAQDIDAGFSCYFHE